MNNNHMMRENKAIVDRRNFLKKSAMVAMGSLWVPGAFAEFLEKTPPQVEGPFYPDKMPLDTDNDLLVISDAISSVGGSVC